MRNLWLPAAIVLGGVLSPALFCAKITSRHSDPAPLIFTALFPKPTGQNGYEEFVLAADLLNATPACQEYEADYVDQRGAALDKERKALADPTVQRVLVTLRAGLKKRIRSPRETPELHTLVPELKTFRALGRLLCAEMDVQFADGHTSKVIDCLNDGLNFGRAVQVGQPVSGVVGLYIENVTLQAFSRHLNQLTLPDCARLLRVANFQSQRSEPQIVLVAAERDMFLRSLRKYRTNAIALLVQMDPGPNASASDHEDYRSVCQGVRANPDSGAQLFDQAAKLVTAHFDGTLAEIKRPVWERTYPVPSERVSPAAKLVYAFFPASYARMGDRFASERALLHILAVHAAVLQYQKQRGHLPESVEELNLGSLAIDPFTGTSLGYKRLGDQAYQVRSVGGNDSGDAKHPSSGQRVPIVVSYPVEGEQ